MKLITVLFIAFIVPAAQASFVFSPTLFMIEKKAKDDNETVGQDENSRVLLLDLRLGYMLPGEVYIGAIYGIENGEGISRAQGTNLSASRYGISLGMFWYSFNLMGHYFLKGDYHVKSGDTQYDYSSGSGIQIDAGWNLTMGSTIGFGPQFTYRNMNYKGRTKSVGSVVTESSQNYNRTEIEPRLAFWFSF